MKQTLTRHSLHLTVLSLIMVAVMILSLTACGSKNNSDSSADTVSYESGSELGEGEKTFSFEVVDKEGKTSTFVIHTDEETVGAALIKLGMIDGEPGEFGLYVKAVNGIKADYDTDGVYWAFYANGTYASSGVDTTEISPDTVYSFKVE